MPIKEMDFVSREYWNDIEIEKKKPYWIEDVSDLKLLHFLQEETNLQRCFQDAMKFAEKLGGIRRHVLDIGAGVAWTSALLSKKDEVESITATDYSEHRLKKIGPTVFKQLKGNKDKFMPIVGDFLELDFQVNHYQTIIFCQSLYMFPDLRSVMDKVSKLLVSGGIIMITCERITPEFPIYSINSVKKN
jgi:ubiquinone/menaquinone biosynthesis C-methylase UbiE